MGENFRKSDIYTITQTMIDAIEAMEKSGNDRALLSAFRHSIGKPLSQSSDIWNFLFSYMPEKYLSFNGNETNGERAICTTLQLYALHRQGNGNHSSSEYINFGKSIGKLRSIIGEDVLDKRMNMVLTADDFDEISYRLRQILKLCKSRETVNINFAKLAEDLYRWLNGRKDKIRVLWAQSYYATQKNNLNQQDVEKNSGEERK